MSSTGRSSQCVIELVAEWVSFCSTYAKLVFDVFCRPLKQRKESETQCQTDCKFDLEVVESKDPVAMDTRSSDYVSR